MKENLCKKKQEIWQVVKWDFKHSQLSVKNTESKGKDLTIDLDKIRVLIPFKEADKRGDIMVLSQKTGLAWETAFCSGDEVVATYEQGRLVLDNPET